MQKTLQMKRALRTVLLVLLLSVAGTMKMQAQSFTIGDLNYFVNIGGTSVTVIGHVNGVSASGSLVIPESVTYQDTTYAVTSIGGFAFSSCSGLSGSLTIPNSVTTIGDYAFNSCTGFTNCLTIGNSVTSIGAAAFANCVNFTSIHFNASHCESMGYVEEEDYWYFVFYNNTSLHEIVIGDNVTSIPTYAFANHNSQNCQLVLGNALETIGDYAFYNGADENYPGLVGDLSLPNSVIEIGKNAFYGCRGLTGNLTIGNSVTTIGIQAFRECSGFTGNLTIGNSVTTIDHLAFHGCSGFTGSLIIPNSVTTIGNYAFNYCSGFTGSLIIPNSVTTIGQGAFYGCSGFSENITIGNSVNLIREWAFYGCSGITSITALSVTPPTLYQGVFIDVPCTTLTVSCHCIPAYEASEWHDYFTTIIEDCTGIEEDNENLISIYPNPTTSKVNIEAENIKHITISNLLGQTIYESNASGNAFEYDFGKHEDGVYLIRIETAIGEATKRVILMK